jgi:hypothetical protein
VTSGLGHLAGRIAERMKHQAKRNMTLSRLVWRYRLETQQPSWGDVVAQDHGAWNALVAASDAPRILIATSMGGYLAGTAMESLLAAALRVRGAAVDVLLCDAALPACHMCLRASSTTEQELMNGGPRLCRSCHDPAARMYETLGLTLRHYSQYLSVERIEEARTLAREVPFDRIDRFTHDGLALGEHAIAGALRFYGRGELEHRADVETIARRFLEAALRTKAVMTQLLDTHRYDCIVFHHGIYVPQGVIGEVARQRGVRIVNWNAAYRKHSFVFSHGDSYHRTMLSEHTDEWRDLELSPAQRGALRTYLCSRSTATHDWIWFHAKPDFDIAAFCRARGLDARPRIGVLTSVAWDARLHYPSNAFPNMLEWIYATVRYAARRPDLQFVIRTHPAEVNGASPASQRVADEIARVFPTVPPNVVVIAPDEAVSTYALMDTCDSVIVYNTKTGIELAARGIPVIVAGEAWIRGKGFTTDVSSPDAYERALDRLPAGRRMDPDAVELAERYAYHFFFRRMIPVRLLVPTGDSRLYRHALGSWRDLAEGRDPGLDVICDGILHGSAFTYPGDEMP